MDLSALVRSAVAIADSVTPSLQIPIQIEAFVSFDKHVKPTYAAPVTVAGFVMETTRTFPQKNGDVLVATAKITFPRNQDVHQQDRITLPDGRSGPVLAVKSPLDPAGGAYVTAIWIGKE